MFAIVPVISVNLSGSTSYSRLVYSDTPSSKTNPQWELRTFVSAASGSNNLMAGLKINNKWQWENRWSLSSLVRAVGTNQTHYKNHKHAYRQQNSTAILFEK
jgi:hypothetical protein